jgi:hypothetical protein
MKLTITYKKESQRRRDIPNPSTIHQVPKTLQIPRKKKGKPCTYCNKTKS